jgi:hypothetical protein
MLTLRDVLKAANELGEGNRAPSLKYALWLAALSPQKSLAENSRASQVLRRYVRGSLPKRETLRRNLREARVGMLYESMLDALYWVEMLEFFGVLKAYETLPESAEGWVAWRDGLRDVVKGHGLGYKCLSFAALLFDPLGCDLVPVDRHVLARLGYKQVGSPQSRKRYTAVERQVRDERDAAGYAALPVALWHWLKWEEWRQFKHESEGREGCESHAGLSVRRYS